MLQKNITKALKNALKSDTILQTGDFCSKIILFRRIKICRDPEEDHAEAAEAVDLEAEAEASAEAVVDLAGEDLADSEDLIITDRIITAAGILDRAIVITAGADVLEV